MENKMWLRDMFVARKREFDTYTQELLKIMLPLRQAIDEFMNFNAMYKRGGVLTWTEIVFVAEKEINESVVILIGNISYPVGTEIQLKSGAFVKVTEDTEEYFTKMIRIGVPYNIAVGTKEEAIAYFTRAQQIAEQELEKELDLVQMDAEHPDVSIEPEFDMSKLTPEQVEQLKKYSIIGKA